MATPRLACVGDNCIDRYLAPLNYALVGGNAVNVAVQAARLGCTVAYFGAVGADAEGQRLRATLRSARVALKGLRIVAGQSTATTDIATSPDGERHFQGEDFGACAAYQPDDAAYERLTGFDHVHIGWLNDGGVLKRRLARAGLSVSQDLSVNNQPENLTADSLTIAFASAIPAAAEHLAASLQRDGAALAVVTMGAAGSLAFDGHQWVRAAALAVDAIDTTGAGDSFIAGFLSSRLRGGDLPAALAAGAEQASTTCLHIGGFPQTLQALDA